MDTREVQTALVALGYALVVDGVAGLFLLDPACERRRSA